MLFFTSGLCHSHFQHKFAADASVCLSPALVASPALSTENTRTVPWNTCLTSFSLELLKMDLRLADVIDAAGCATGMETSLDASLHGLHL